MDDFRKLLLLKAKDNDLIEYLSKMQNEVLHDLFWEALEKMAFSSAKGRSANPNMIHYGKSLSSEVDAPIIHDALSHHASHYKAAIDSGRQDLADKHARKMFHIINTVQKAGTHSDDGVHIEAVDPKPWERNKHWRRKADGSYVTDTKGFNYDGTDFRFLRDEPHPAYYNEVKGHGHTGAYPLHEIKVNGKHLDIQDVPTKYGYTPHFFDSHPAVRDHKKAAKDIDHEAATNFKQELHQWDEQHKFPFLDKLDEMEKNDPEGFAARGTVKPEPLHEQHEESPYNEHFVHPETGEKIPVNSPEIRAKILQDAVQRQHSKAQSQHRPDNLNLQLPEGLENASPEERTQAVQTAIEEARKRQPDIRRKGGRQVEVNPETMRQMQEVAAQAQTQPQEPKPAPTSDLFKPGMSLNEMLEAYKNRGK